MAFCARVVDSRALAGAEVVGAPKTKLLPRRRRGDCKPSNNHAPKKLFVQPRPKTQIRRRPFFMPARRRPSLPNNKREQTIECKQTNAPQNAIQTNAFLDASVEAAQSRTTKFMVDFWLTTPLTKKLRRKPSSTRAWRRPTLLPLNNPPLR